MTVQYPLSAMVGALRNTAERDNNDIIANAASDLATRLDRVGTVFGTRLEDLTELDHQIIEHAMNNHHQEDLRYE